MEDYSFDNIKVLISKDEIDNIVKGIANRINEDYKGREIVFVGILKGAFIFLADLVRYIELPIYIDFLGVSSYGDATVSSGIVKITRDISFPILGKDVIIVEDIIDTGLTMKYLMKTLGAKKPNSIEICTLLLKKGKAELGDLNIKYVGKEIEDYFVVGYGLDWANRYRHLPYIGYIEK